MKAELVAAVGAELGEGAVLFPDGSVRWVDLLRGQTFRWVDGVNAPGPEFPHEVAKVLPGSSDDLVVGRESVMTLSTEPRVVAAIGAEGSNVRGSDAAILPDGSLVFGVVDRDLGAGAGSLRWTDGVREREVVGGATIPNGVAVMPDAHRVVWTDSPTQRLDVFDIDPHEGLVDRRPYAAIPEGFGTPDGLCVDDEGGVWVAMWGGGCVVRIGEEGGVDAVVEIGTPHVTSCAFDRDDNLIVTTAAVVLSREERRRYPGAGGLWLVEQGTHGAHGARTYSASRLLGAPL